MIPHEAAQHAVHTVAADDHVADFNIAVAEFDFDPIGELLGVHDTSAGLDERLVGQAIVKNLQELAPFQREEANPMTVKVLVFTYPEKGVEFTLTFPRRACTEHCRGSNGHLKPGTGSA